ncbi:hypothetical protein SDC9_151116 [bioreactor metagenome]|uniref:Uncharacterized protein n=1 Tax=bioreactor metagenome TaxID=1076179 RepID=A0A645EPE0_9ZZZZ
MLAGLRHRAVRRAHNQDRAVHLGGTGDHVLNIVRVTRAVNVRIVTRFRFVLDVRGVDRDSTRFLFRRLVDFVVLHRLGFALLRQRHRDRRRQRRLAVVYVPDRPDVDVRFRSLEFCLCHYNQSS